MSTAVLEREPPVAGGARTTARLVGDLDPRLGGAIKAIIESLGATATRQKLRTAARQQGYSEAEFEAALNCLVETSVEVANEATPVAAIKAFTPGQAPTPGSFDPQGAGARLVEELKAVEGGAWTGAELLERFGLTPAVLHRRRKEHRILYWRDARHEFHYPRWQFTPSGALIPGVQEVLQTFSSADEWRLMSYFLGQRQQLGNRRPLDLLQAGETREVLEHARLHAGENTW